MCQPQLWLVTVIEFFNASASNIQDFFFIDSLVAVCGSDVYAFSTLTVSIPQDVGWYHAKCTDLQKLSFDHGSGCDFVDEKCVYNGDVPSYTSWFFCNAEASVTLSSQFSING